MKIAVNKCYGGFSLSPLAIKEYLKLSDKEAFFYKKDYETQEFNAIPIEHAGGFDDICLTKDYGPTIKGGWKFFCADYFDCTSIKRNDINLIEVIENLGSQKASGNFTELKVVEIPDDVQWEIDNYDGMETIRELHRSW